MSVLKSLFFVVSFFGFSQVFAKDTTLSKTIKSIEITGNTKTKTSIILRELSFQVDSVSTEENFQNYHIPRSISNLKNLNLFNDISIVLTEFDNNWTVKITVIEKWYLWPIPFVEFADRNFNQWYTLDLDPGRTNFGLYLFKYNLFGLNHTLKLTAGTGYTNTFGLEYRAPYIDKKKKLGFHFKLHRKSSKEIQYDIADNKELFFNDGENIANTQWINNTMLTYRPRLYTTHSIFNDYMHTSVADTVLSSSLNPEFTANATNQFSSLEVGYGISFDKRNNKLFPTSGLYGNLQLSYVNVVETTSFGKVEAEISHALKLKPNSKFSFAGAAKIYRISEDNNIPYVMQKALGYDYYFRGYETNIFLAKQYILTKLECRFHLLSDKKFNLKHLPISAYRIMPVETYISGFTDFGTVQSFDKNYQLVGFGIGLNSLFYYDKVIRFEYSWNHWNQSGFKLHFKKAF